MCLFQISKESYLDSTNNKNNKIKIKIKSQKHANTQIIKNVMLWHGIEVVEFFRLLL